MSAPYHLYVPSAPIDTFAAGTVIYSQGDIGSQMFLVTRGQVALERAGHAAALIDVNGMFGEQALIDPAPRPVTARALTDCEVVVVDARVYAALVQQSPDFAVDVMRAADDHRRLLAAHVS